MKRLILFIFVTLFALTCGPGFAAADENQKAANNNQKFAHWSELSGKVGQMCTIFEGTQKECIRVRYLGTTPHPADQNERAILIELLDKRRAPKNATPVAGTSGSPVYFEFKIRDGWWRTRTEWRLAGAAAFMFTDFPIGGQVMGVTPIKAIISGSTAKTLAVNLPTAIEVSGFGMQNIRWLPICIEPAGESDNEKPFCFNRQAGPASQKNETASRRPEPGDSVTVIFPSGGGAICTVTYVKDNRFWACGHGIVQGGYGEQRVAFQSYRTQIAMTVFSARNSYKLYDRDLEFFGTIIKNTQMGIEGVIHEKDKPIE